MKLTIIYVLSTLAVLFGLFASIIIIYADFYYLLPPEPSKIIVFILFSLLSVSEIIKNIKRYSSNIFINASILNIGFFIIGLILTVLFVFQTPGVYINSNYWLFGLISMLIGYITCSIMNIFGFLGVMKKNKI